jgi:hypothetical protein
MRRARTPIVVGLLLALGVAALFAFEVRYHLRSRATRSSSGRAALTSAR